MKNFFDYIGSALRTIVSVGSADSVAYKDYYFVPTSFRPVKNSKDEKALPIVVTFEEVEVERKVWKDEVLPEAKALQEKHIAVRHEWLTAHKDALQQLNETIAKINGFIPSVSEDVANELKAMIASAKAKFVEIHGTEPSVPSMEQCIQEILREISSRPASEPEESEVIYSVFQFAKKRFEESVLKDSLAELVGQLGALPMGKKGEVKVVKQATMAELFPDVKPLR